MSDQDVALTPVEGNPFENGTLTEVEGNPFEQRNTSFLGHMVGEVKGAAADIAEQFKRPGVLPTAIPNMVGDIMRMFNAPLSAAGAKVEEMFPSLKRAQEQGQLLPLESAASVMENMIGLTMPVARDFDVGVLQPAVERMMPKPQIAPVEGSQVPRNVARTDLATTGEPHVDAVLHSDVTKDVIDNPIVDRSHTVPYTAGGSVPLEDPTVFIDSRFPRSFTIDGVTFDPADPFAVHENVEQHTMDLLIKGGMTPEEAYRVAHFEFAEKAEGAWYEAHGIDQARAEAAYAPYMAEIQKAPATDVPSNLYKRPYPHDQPSAAAHEAISEPRPSPAEIAQAKDIIAKATQAGDLKPGGANAVAAPDPLAGLQQARDLGIIGPDRTPPLDEPPAKAAQRAIPAARTGDDKITMTPAGEPIDAWQARFKDWVSRIKEPEDVKPFIEQSAAENNNFQQARAGTVDPAHVEVVAEAAGIDPTKIDRGDFSAKFNTPDKIRMVKQALDQALTDFRDAANKVTDDASEANVAKMLEAQIRRDYVLEYTLGLRAEWGRAGHALRQLLEPLEGETGINDLLKSKGRTPEDMQDIARGMRGLDDAQAARVLTDMRGQGQHWFYWMWVQGLISGPFTHAKYIAANALYAATERGVVTPMAAVLGKLKELGGPNPDRVFFGETMAAHYGTIAAVPDAIKAAWQTLKNGVRVPLESEVELRQLAEARGERVPALERAVNPVTQQARPIPGIWGRIIGAPGDAASAIHTTFKVLGERANLEMWAYNKAAAEGLNPTGQAFWERRAFHAANPSEQALKDSVYQAYKDTFMQELGDTATSFQRWAKQNPVVKWLIPFAHIPINLMKATYEYTPLAVLDKDMRSAILGEKGGRAQDLAIARMTVGSAVMGYFFHKYMNGEATGAYPIDQNERKQWQLMGTQANSIKIGDQWVSFDRFGPAGDLARMGANIGNVVHHYILDRAGPNADEAMAHATFLAAKAAGDLVTDEVGFQSLRNLFEAATDEKKGTRWAAWQAGSFLPFSSLVSQTASFADPNMRVAQSFLAGLQYRMPRLRENLLPKRDPLYGEPVPNPGYGNIIRKSPIAMDPVKQELDRLQLYPAAPRNSVGGVKLTPELFDRYEATAGPLVRQALTALVTQPGWQDVPAEARRETMQAVITAMRQRAGAALQADQPQLIQQGLQRRLDRINGTAAR